MRTPQKESPRQCQATCRTGERCKRDAIAIHAGKSLCDTHHTIAIKKLWEKKVNDNRR